MSDESYILTENIDRISSLPDDVLLCILSKLTTKTAIRTCILSSRWRYLWASMNVLDKHTPKMRGSPAAPSSLVDSIERILQGANSSQMQKLRMHSDYRFNNEHIASWICEAVRRGVREVDISVWNMKVPTSFFTCNTITALKLVPRGPYHFPNVPDSVCFPNLKTLRLWIFNPPNDFTQNLFRRCPALEDLTLEGYQYAGTIYDISSPSLRRFSFEIRDKVHSGPVIELRLNAPNLMYFHLCDELAPVNCCVKELPAFAEVSIELTTCCESRSVSIEHVPRVSKLLQGISGGKSISLDCGATDIICGFPEVDVDLPTFCNLTHLEITFPRCCEWDLLFFLLERSPNLEVVTIIKECDHMDEFMSSDDEYEIYEGEDDMDFNDEDFAGESDSEPEYENDEEFHKLMRQFIEWNEQSSPPKCLLLHLEIFKIGGFLGMADGLEVICYILSRAQVLKKLIVELRNIDPHQKAKFRNKILKFPRASSDCEIQFVRFLDGTSFLRKPTYVMPTKSSDER